MDGSRNTAHIVVTVGVISVQDEFSIAQLYILHGCTSRLPVATPYLPTREAFGHIGLAQARLACFTSRTSDFVLTARLPTMLNTLPSQHVNPSTTIDCCAVAEAIRQ